MEASSMLVGKDHSIARLILQDCLEGRASTFSAYSHAYQFGDDDTLDRIFNTSNTFSSCSMHY
jgi:hypothetical protein